MIRAKPARRASVSPQQPPSDPPTSPTVTSGSFAMKLSARELLVEAPCHRSTAVPPPARNCANRIRLDPKAAPARSGSSPSLAHGLQGNSFFLGPLSTPLGVQDLQRLCRSRLSRIKHVLDLGEDASRLLTGASRPGCGWLRLRLSAQSFQIFECDQTGVW